MHSSSQRIRPVIDLSMRISLTNISLFFRKMAEDEDLDGVFLHVFESRRYDHEKPKDRIEEAVQQLALINWLEEHIRLDDSYLRG